MASPFLAVSLDAVNHAADLGRASGLTEEAAGWGLVRMWAHAFRSKVDVVTPHQVSGFFGGDVARVAVALMAFGFLEASGADFRVIVPVSNIGRPRTRKPRAGVYFMRIGDGHGSPIKIGRTRDVDHRRRALQTGHVGTVRVVGFVACRTADATALEAQLHARFAHLRLRGEWFSDGDDLLAYIEGLG